MNRREGASHLRSTWGELGLNFSGFILMAGSTAVVFPYSLLTQKPLMFFCAVILAAVGVRLVWLAMRRKNLRSHGATVESTDEDEQLETRQTLFSGALIVGGLVLAFSSQVFLANSQLVAAILLSGLITSAIGVWLMPLKPSQKMTGEIDSAGND